MSRAVAITGAGAGLGSVLARVLCAQGDSVFLLGRTPSRLKAAAEQIAQTGGAAYAIPCDVADPEAVDRAFQRIAELTSRLDVLVNNAGIFAPFFLEEASNGQLSEALGTNLAGPMYCSRAALRQMDRGGHILCIGSETVATTAAMLGAYQTAKAGLERYCKTLDQEVAPRGIRVTLVRAGKMYGPEMGATMSPDVARRFRDECLKMGIDNTKSALSSYESVAGQIVRLLDLPEDLHVPEVHFVSRHS